MAVKAWPGIIKIKQLLTSDPVLRVYDRILLARKWPHKPTLHLLDKEHASFRTIYRPVSYVSRALTETEKHWYQIEKELPALTFAAEHFHHDIYRREVEVENDHKPLKMIIWNLLQNASPRIQLILLRLLRYQVRPEF